MIYLNIVYHMILFQNWVAYDAISKARESMLFGHFILINGRNHSAIYEKRIKNYKKIFFLHCV